jgi:hypothetical protein
MQNAAWPIKTNLTKLLIKTSRKICHFFFGFSDLKISVRSKYRAANLKIYCLEIVFYFSSFCDDITVVKRFKSVNINLNLRHYHTKLFIKIINVIENFDKTDGT